MTDAPPPLEVLGVIMLTGADWMYKLMADVEKRPPSAVVLMPQFQLLLTATTLTLTFLTKMSLAVITDELITKKFQESKKVPTKVVKKVPKKGVKKVPDIGTKKVPKNGVKEVPNNGTNKGVACSKRTSY